MSKSSGVSFLGLLTILFIGLKLTGYVMWSWWLVLLPLYGPLAIVATVSLVVFMFAFTYALFANGKKSKK